MIILKNIKGIGASEGIAVGPIFYLESLDLTVKEEECINKEEEKKRFEKAQKEAIEQLDELYEKTKKENEDSAKVFEIHQMLISDLDFTESVEAIIEEGKKVEWAIHQTAMNFKAIFEAMDDELMQARAADVIDIRNRLIKILKGIKEDKHKISEKVILTAEELLPSDIVKFDTKSILGFVTKFGSRTSHASIIARTLNIPIVVGVSEFSLIPHKGMLAINGKLGDIIIEPDESTINDFQEKIAEEKVFRKSLEKYRGKEAITKSGHKIIVAANIGDLKDVDLVIENDADAVGLFRSEFIYLESSNYPTEEKQFFIYKEVVRKLAPRNVIIRTLDIGADKTVGYFNLDKEENPALGYRAIRICLKEPDIFKTQLKALLRASAFGNLSIMFPMITHIEQVKNALDIVNEVKQELKADNIPYSDDVKIGVMIETPAAVMISEKLAQMVDFFSIGTNDLTQYTLAVDRMNSKISSLFDQRHESVLKMISITAENAHKMGKWVGICGESASDLELLDFYIDNKIDELSVTPSKVLLLKKEILEIKG